MGDAYRGARVYRDRDSDSDDDRYRSTTVTRYKVAPGRGGGERYERSDRIDVDDDRRSRFSGRTSGDFLDDRRAALSPDRPRSAFDPHGGDRARTFFYERDVERDVRREPDRSRVAVYEDDREWDRRSRHGRHEDEIKVEKKVVEERFDDENGHEVERYRKETEYYAPQRANPSARHHPSTGSGATKDHRPRGATSTPYCAPAAAAWHRGAARKGAGPRDGPKRAGPLRGRLLLSP